MITGGVDEETLFLPILHASNIATDADLARVARGQGRWVGENSFDHLQGGEARALDRQPVILASEESHHSLDKAAQQVGLGRNALIRVPVSGLTEGMDPTALEAAIARAIARLRTLGR